MKNIILSISIAFVSTTSIAQPVGGVNSEDYNKLQLNSITTAMPFLDIAPDSRAGAMANAGTAISASSSSLYWNTSMLAFSEDKGEISISYTPWLRQLANDIHLSTLAGYGKIGDRHSIGGSLRFFSLGEITFTDQSGGVIRNDRPSEYEILAGYAFKLSEKIALGVNAKFAYSNLTGGLPVAGAATKAGLAGMADISFTYRKDDFQKNNNEYSLGITINNIGNKVTYTPNAQEEDRDFLPTNLKIGNAYKMKFNEHNTLTISLDLQKLLVPTPQKVYNINSQPYVIGKSSVGVGVIGGMLSSFGDAPGELERDENGNYIPEGDGYKLQKGSKFKEELTEINVAIGAEYWYNDLLALRAGFFYEHPTKGARQFFNVGIGLKYKKFGADFSYLAALKRNNPLANTLRFSLRYIFGHKEASNSDEE